MPVKIGLPQMVDLALGTPEVGAVNFNVLHTLLHAMLRRLNITDVTADMNELDLISRQRSAMSDLDSGVSTGKGDDSEDGMSESGRSPYHQLEQKVAKLTMQMEQMNSIPSNTDLLDRSERPISEMWQFMQLKKKVDANTDGVDKLASLVDDLMSRMDELRKANKDILSRLDSLNMDDFMARLKELENSMKSMNERFESLPTTEDLAQFVTWPSLEDALNGVKKDWENLQPPERVVIEMTTQTEPSSRPPSSRPGTRMSTASSGPSESLLEILERLGKLSESHEELQKRVDDLEEQLKNKLDKSALDNLNLSSDLLEKLGKLKEEIDALNEAREKGVLGYSKRDSSKEKDVSQVVSSNKPQGEVTPSLQHDNSSDSDALSRAQAAILQLQADFEKLHNTTQDMIEENENRSKQIESLFKYCDKLSDTKADKEYVQMEVDVKADKRSLDHKVNHSLFDTTTAEINKMIKEILDKLSGYEDNFNTTCYKLNEDIDGKLDRLELDPLKEWLESKLKALNDKIKRQQNMGEWSEDDAAGIRKQLIQKFHCISCDRPVDLVPTGPVPCLPTNTGLAPTRSPRPYTTFELDQIRQHAKSFANPEVSDYYATTRACGGNHTTTFPNKRITRLSHLSHLFREDEEAVYPIYKEEVDVQGADGHIYKGRVEKLEAKLTNMSRAQESYKPHVRTSTPPPINQGGQMTAPAGKPHRPRSARPQQSPRPTSSKQASRPMSAKGGGSRQATPGPDSSHTTPVPPEIPSDQGDARIEVPTSGD